MSVKPGQLLLGILLILSLSACQGLAAQTPLGAMLSEVQGMVGVKSPEKMDFSPAQNGSPFPVHAQLRTGQASRARLDLSTGVILRVGPAALLELTDLQLTSARLRLEVGRLFVILDSGSLDVETPSGVASVRGSFMMVEVDATQDVHITCLEGHCESSNPAGKVQFGAGQRSILLHRDPAAGQYAAPSLESMTEADYQAWAQENPEAQALVERGLAALSSAPISTVTSTPQPVLVSLPSPTPLIIPSVTAVVVAPLEPCIGLLSPADKAVVEYNNPVTFEWKSRLQASKYALTLFYPDGTQATFETTETQLTRFFDELPASLTFIWQVSALDDKGNAMCQSPQARFTKPAAEATRVKQGIVCTQGQWTDPNAPCYCETGSTQSYCH